MAIPSRTVPLRAIHTDDGSGMGAIVASNDPIPDGSSIRPCTSILNP